VAFDLGPISTASDATRAMAALVMATRERPHMQTEANICAFPQQAAGPPAASARRMSGPASFSAQGQT